MTPEKQLTALCKIVHRQLQGITHITRCLSSSGIMARVLEEAGWEVQEFPCGFMGFSKAMYERMQRNEPMPKSKPALEELRAQGVRMLAVYANRPDVEPDNFPEGHTPLGGHMALIVRKGDQAFFVDPTAYQMRRKPNKHGWTLDMPHYVVTEQRADIYDTIRRRNEMPREDIPESHTFHFQTTLACGGAVIWGYERLDSIEALRASRSSEEYLNSDLNLERYEQQIEAVSELFQRQVEKEQ